MGQISDMDATTLVILAPNNASAIVILDGSLSTDSEKGPLQFAWRLQGEATPFDAGSRVTNVVERGDYNVVLDVSDGTQNATATLFLKVITPTEATDTLRALLEDSAVARNIKHELQAVWSQPEGRSTAARWRAESKSCGTSNTKLKSTLPRPMRCWPRR